MANIKYLETKQSKINTIDIVPGQRILCTDTLNEYYDTLDGERIKMKNEEFPIVEAEGTNAYAGTNKSIVELEKNVTKFILILKNDSTSTCSLNLNKTKNILIKNSYGETASNMKANIPYLVFYNGQDFILLGKGGGGNLVAKYLLSGYYGEGDRGRVNGSMINRGNLNTNLNCGNSVSLSEGYYTGGKITANTLASQTAATATINHILNGYTAWVNGQKITGKATIQNLGGATYQKLNINVATQVTASGGNTLMLDLGFALSEKDIILVTGKAWNYKGTEYTVKTVAIPMMRITFYESYKDTRSKVLNIGNTSFPIMYCGLNVENGAASIDVYRITLP